MKTVCPYRESNNYSSISHPLIYPYYRLTSSDSLVPPPPPPQKAVKIDYAVLSVYFTGDPDLAQMELWTVPFDSCPFSNALSLSL
jgi:hypothetical protein